MSTSVVCILPFLVCCCIAQNDFSPAILPPVTIDAEYGSCPSAEALNQARNDTKKAIRNILQNHPYCLCGGPGEWRQIAHLDMSDPNQQCPPNLKLNLTVTTPVRGCGRPSNITPRCDSTVFPVDDQPYSRVCGRVRGYPKGEAEGFFLFNRDQNTLNDVYMNGVSLTHGTAGSREHIWSFVYASNRLVEFACRCTNPNVNWPYQVPPFVGDNYFCESGPNPAIIDAYSPGDPLWDGEGCDSPSTCCQFNHPPWFCTTLPESTTDDVELRLCHNGPYEDVAIDLIDIYVM